MKAIYFEIVCGKDLLRLCERKTYVVALFVQKKMTKIESKLTVLAEIRDKRDVLFGSFSDKLSKADKVEAWKTILRKCQSLGLVGPEKEYQYIRDTYWSNIKRATLVRTYIV